TGQEGKAHPPLPDDDWPQLRRGAPRDPLAHADGEAQGLDAGQLAARRGRDHRRLGLRRRGQGDLPGGLGGAATVHQDRARAELTASANDRARAELTASATIAPMTALAC